MDQVLVDRLARFRAGADRFNQQLDYERQTIVRLQGKIDQLEKDKVTLVKAVGLIDRCNEVISANGIGKIESIVTGGLRLVFNDPTLGLIVEKKEGARGNSYALLAKQGDVVGPPMDTVGGGPVNVMAFLLRLILIKRFKLAKFLALDESLNNIGKEGGDLARTSAMLKQLCRDHGFTILVTTHESSESGLVSAADAVYRVFTENGRPLLKKVDLSDASQAENTGGNRGELPGDDSPLPSPVVKA